MKAALLFCFFLFSLSLQAQISQPNAIRLYRQGDQVFISDSAGTTPPAMYAYTNVSIAPFGNRIRVMVEGTPMYYAPSKILGKTGTAYGSTVLAALAGYSSTNTGTVTPGFGVSPPTSADYTSSSTITTTNAVKIFLENIGSANASFSYAGLSYTLLPGEQRSFAVDTDPTTGKLVPFAALSVNGTASTIRVTLVPKQ